MDLCEPVAWCDNFALTAINTTVVITPCTYRRVKPSVLSICCCCHLSDKIYFTSESAYVSWEQQQPLSIGKCSPYMLFSRTSCINVHFLRLSLVVQLTMSAILTVPPCVAHMKVIYGCNQHSLWLINHTEYVLWRTVVVRQRSFLLYTILVCFISILN